MAFAGTTQKCISCDKTNVSCRQAHGRQPHLPQGLLPLPPLPRNSQGTLKIAKLEKPIDGEKPLSSKVSGMFGGTRDKCLSCKKTAYPTEKVPLCSCLHFSCYCEWKMHDKSIELHSTRGETLLQTPPYHKSCFKCTHGRCTISPSNYIAHEGRLYCRHHHAQLIKEKGNLSQLKDDHDNGTPVVV